MEPSLKIGLTYTGTDEKHNNYVKWLTGNDKVSIVRLSAEENNSELVEELDGIVLSGGIDMHPKYYSGELIYPNAPDQFNDQRDEFEQTVFEQCIQFNKPILGVCRGMQLVNCLLGGSLVQDIGIAANNLHRFDKKDKLHDTEILPGTLLEHILHSGRVVTNSAHHQAIAIPGKALKVNARSVDGIIEGIEWADPSGKPFFLGVQWHPERMIQAGLQDAPATKNIRERFITEVKKSKKI